MLVRRGMKKLKHKDSFGKSENLSKIFFAEILVFDHDYEGKSSSSNGLLWISFIKKKKLFELFFELFGGPPNKSIHVINYTLQGVIIIKSLICLRFKVWKLFRNTLDSVLSNIEQVLFFKFFFTKTISVL